MLDVQIWFHFYRDSTESRTDSRKHSLRGNGLMSAAVYRKPWKPRFGDSSHKEAAPKTRRRAKKLGLVPWATTISTAARPNRVLCTYFRAEESFPSDKRCVSTAKSITALRSPRRTTCQIDVIPRGRAYGVPNSNAYNGVDTPQYQSCVLRRQEKMTFVNL